MNPLHQLMDDHELILQVLDKMEMAVQKIKSGDEVNLEHWEYFTSFFRDFADGIHHHKEEQLLFPVLVKAGIPMEGGPIGCMLNEHNLGRDCVRRIQLSLDQYKKGQSLATKDMFEAAEEYLPLLRQHIAKENQVLFMMAEKLLSISEKSRMKTEFESFLSEEGNQKVEQGLRQAFENVANAY